MAANNTIIHGHNQRGKRSKTYAAWRSMMQRCNNPNNKAFANYGGRGIAVCERWLSFVHFLADMGEVPTGLTLERKNNALGYSPENCVWATMREQVLNRRNTALVEFGGELRPVQVLADLFGFKCNTIKRRLKKGWSIESALTVPLMSHKEICFLGAHTRWPGDSLTKAIR